MEAYELLEKEIGEWAGYPAENVVCCNSGSAALHLALEALRLPPGSEVIVPTFTMIACARSVTLAGLTPVFVDCGEDLLTAPWLLYEAVSRRARAVMLVHVYGRVCDRKEAYYVAGEHGLAVVEDCAEAHGAALDRDFEPDAVAHSFYRNKIAAGEEGGSVAFAKAEHAALARCLRCQGFTPEHDFRHVPRGMNYRLANALASPIIDSLRQSPWNLQTRRRIEGWYDAHCPPEWRMPPRDVCWVFDLRIPGLTRERQGVVVRALNAAGVAARHSFLPMHLQEEYRGCRRVGGEVAERMSAETFYLPVQPGVTTEESAARAFDVIRRALAPEKPC